MPARELPVNPRKRLGMEPQPYKNCAICQYALNISTAPHGDGSTVFCETQENRPRVFKARILTLLRNDDIITLKW